MDHARKEMTLSSLMDGIRNMNIKNGKPIALSIDEIDKACNCAAFISFISALRDEYLSLPKLAFRSVILAGVRDARHLATRSHEEHASPWNIAAPLDENLGFSAEDIETMLLDYEADHHIGFSAKSMSSALRDWTNGYPYLVSKLCSILDAEASALSPLQRQSDIWTSSGLAKAVETLCKDKDVCIFQSLKNQLEDSKELRSLLQELLYGGKAINQSAVGNIAELAILHGFVAADRHGYLSVSNKIFESFLYGQLGCYG
jgi:hypothetical protein